MTEMLDTLTFAVMDKLLSAQLGEGLDFHIQSGLPLEIVLAVLKAMRDPTDAMVEAGRVANTCALPDGRTIAMAVEPAWEAMIDAARGRSPTVPLVTL